MTNRRILPPLPAEAGDKPTMVLAPHHTSAEDALAEFLIKGGVLTWTISLEEYRAQFGQPAKREPQP